MVFKKVRMSDAFKTAIEAEDRLENIKLITKYKKVAESPKMAKVLSNPIDAGIERYLKVAAKNSNCAEALTHAVKPVTEFVRKNVGPTNIELSVDLLLILHSVNNIRADDFTDLLKGRQGWLENLHDRLDRKHEERGGNSDKIEAILNKTKEFLDKHKGHFDLKDALAPAYANLYKNIEESKALLIAGRKPYVGKE